MLTVTRSLLLWPERWHELATVLRQLDAGIAGQQVSDLIDESYSPDADDALNVITCADVANPTADPQLLRRQRQEINTAAMYAHYLPLHEYPLEMCDLWPYHGKIGRTRRWRLPRCRRCCSSRSYDPTTPYRNAQVMAAAFKAR